MSAPPVSYEPVTEPMDTDDHSVAVAFALKNAYKQSSTRIEMIRILVDSLNARALMDMAKQMGIEPDVLLKWVASPNESKEDLQTLRDNGGNHSRER